MAKDLFKRKKNQTAEESKPQQTKIADLESICIDDKQACKALWHTMFLDPRKIGAKLKDAEKKAANFEKKMKIRQSRLWHHIAGGLALWKGDVGKVKQHFTKCAELAPEMDYELIAKMAENATAKAQEYYSEFLK